MAERAARGEPELSPGLRRLWGLDRGARPGQKPSLDVRQVAHAAIELADEGGPSAVSMSRVAAALGVTTMALYRYVESKDELLELMLEVAAGDPPPLHPGLGWRDALASWANGLSALYREHPWTVVIPVPGPPRGPHQLAWAEQGMAALGDTPLTPSERLEAVMLVLVYVRGEASLEVQMTAAVNERAGGDRMELDRQFELLAGGLDPERFPQLRAAMEPGAADARAATAERGSPEGEVGTTGAHGGRDVTFGLERILDGLELLIRRRRRAGRPARS